MSDNLSVVLCFKDQADFHGFHWSRSVGRVQATGKDRSLPAGGNPPAGRKLYAKKQWDATGEQIRKGRKKRGGGGKEKLKQKHSNTGDTMAK